MYIVLYLFINLFVQLEVDPGRGFDSYGVIMWTQRVEKEERGLLKKYIILIMQ